MEQAQDQLKADLKLLERSVTTLKEALHTCNSPREAVKIAFRMNWTKEAEAWLEALEARNQTSHTYNEEVAKEVFEVAKKFPPLVDELIGSLKVLLR